MPGSIERGPSAVMPEETPIPRPEVKVENPKEAAILKTYERKAEERGLKTDTRHMAMLGEWIKTDGLEMYNHGQQDKPFRSPGNMDNPDIIRERLEHIAQYDSNSGVIARINERGEKFVAPYSEFTIEQLKEAGYSSGSFGVPLSSVQYILDRKIQARWRLMQDGARQTRQDKINRDSKGGRKQRLG